MFLLINVDACEEEGVFYFMPEFTAYSIIYAE
jgi:hypothetical protein